MLGQSHVHLGSAQLLRTAPKGWGSQASALLGRRSREIGSRHFQGIQFRGSREFIRFCLTISHSPDARGRKHPHAGFVSIS